MRLLFISSEFPPGPGGISTHAYHLVSHLQKLGWDVAVVTSQNYMSAHQIREFNRLQSFPLESLRAIPFAPFEVFYRLIVLFRWIIGWQPEIILASGSRSVWLVSWLVKWCRIPWTAIGHGTEFGLAGLEWWLTRRSFEAASGVVCVSQYTEQYMLSRGIRVKRSIVIPNGADENKFGILAPHIIEQFRKSLALEDRRVILTVGNVTERKGQDIVIRALPMILKRVPNTTYLIIGLPTLQEKFARLADDLGVAEHIRFLGNVSQDNLVRYMNLCDVFVMVSRHTSGEDFEGYGIAVVEAAFCGKPAVVSANSGLCEAIVDGRTGIEVPEDEPDRVGQALLRLLEDDERRSKMGEAARLRAIREQSWAHQVEKYDSFLRDLVAEGKPSTMKELKL